MFAVKSDILLFFTFIHVFYCQRRVQDGKVVTQPKPYMVYLVKAPVSFVEYDYWLCGGALVTTEFVVTSAACIKDVDFLYVIAGYDTYVTDDQIETDPCTSQKKKKVIYTCFPDGYNMQYDKLDKWAQIDVGIVKVESPYDFEDESFKSVCSYIPASIPISFDSRYQEPGTDAMVLGWGHTMYWRKEKDKNNYNQQKLNYASVLIIDKEICKKEYEIYGNMTVIIDKFMICTFDKGNLDDVGEIENIAPISGEQKKACGANLRQYGVEDEDCQENAYHEYPNDQSLIDETRRHIKNSNSTNRPGTKRSKNISRKSKTARNTTLPNITVSPIVTVSTNRTASTEKSFVSNDDYNKTLRNTRRQGICQNDHGGPLVTWVGTHQILIGIASVFKLTETRECVGPFLYTSTQCTGAFINCILTFPTWPKTFIANDTNTSRRTLCKKSPDDRGHPTLEKHISWKHHPAGAADNERHTAKKKSKPTGKKLKSILRNGGGDVIQSTNIRHIFQQAKGNKGAMNFDNVLNPGNVMNPDNVIDPSNIMNAGNRINSGSVMYTDNVMKPSNVINQDNIMSPDNGVSPSHIRYKLVGNVNPAPKNNNESNIKYGTNQTYIINKDLTPAGNNYATNAGYPVNGNAPYEKYPINGDFANPLNQNVPNDRFATNQYGSMINHYPKEMNSGNYNMYASNVKFQPSNEGVMNEKVLAQENKPASAAAVTIENVETNDSPLIFRPQIPIRV